MKSPFKKYVIIAALVIAAIIGSQIYWLYRTYTGSKTQLLKEVNTVLKEYRLEYMETYFTELAGKDTSIKLEDQESIKMIQNLIQGLSKYSDQMDESLEISIVNPDDSLNKSTDRKDSISVKIDKLNEGLTKAFQKVELPVKYNIFLFRSSDSTLLNPGVSEKLNKSGLRSGNFELTNSNNYFCITLSDYTGYLLGKMKTSILFSFTLIIISIFVFAIFLRTIASQLKLNKLKNDFVNNMTHELKTPLATCGVALESISKFNVIEDKEKTLKYIGIAQDEIKKIEKLAEVLLTASAAENKTLFYNFEKSDLIDLFQTSLERFDLRIKENNIELETIYPKQPLFVKTDVLHLNNIFSNIIDNAIKYNLKGGKIKIQVTRKNKFAEIEISNTGKGFPEEYSEKVFDKFFRVPTNDIHNVKGYGLGLNYAKHVIDAHNGSIKITSGINKLTVLTILLPTYE